MRKIVLLFFIGSLFVLNLPALRCQEGAVQPADTADASELDFANGLYVRQMYRPAISEYEKFIGTHPNSNQLPSAMFRMADSYFFLKEYDKAISHFEVYINKFPGEARANLAWFRIGSSKFYLKDNLSAGGIFQKLVSQETEANIRQGSLFYLGKIYIMRGHPEKGKEFLQRLLSCCSESDYASYAAMELGDLELKADSLDKALSMYQIAAAKSTPLEISIEAKFKIAEIYFSQKKYKDSKDYYTQLYYGSYDKQTLSDMSQSRFEEIKTKSLLGLFYCDRFIEDLDETLKRFEREKMALEKGGIRLEAQWLAANLLIEKEQYETALPYLDGIISDPKVLADLKTKAIFKKSEALSLMDKKDLALQILQEVIDEKSAYGPKAHYEKARILRQSDKFPEAIASLKAISEKEDAALYRKALYEIAENYQEMKDLAKAREVFIEFSKKYHQEAPAERARLEVVQIDIDSGDFDAALDGAVKFVGDCPSSNLLDVAYYQQAMALSGLKKFKESADVFRKIISDYPSSKLIVESLYGLGVNLENLGVFPEAISHYETIITSYPNSPLAPEAFTRLQGLYIKTNSLTKASFLFEDILFKKPNIDIGSEAAFWLVQYFLDNKQYQRMQRVLEIVPSRFPKEDLTHEINFFLGESALGLGEYSKAVEYYTKAVANKPDGSYTPYAYLGMGLAYAALKKTADSEKSFNQVLSFDQEPKAAAHARFEIADLRFKAGDFAEAAKIFMMVAIFYDDAKYSPWALYKAGSCYLKLGKKDEALKAFDELRSRYKESEWAKKVEILDPKLSLPKAA